MSTSERAFNQVKAILGKLDRSIDLARQKRLQTTSGPREPGPGGVGRAQPLRNLATDKLRAESNAFQRWNQ